MIIGMPQTTLQAFLLQPTDRQKQPVTMCKSLGDTTVRQVSSERISDENFDSESNDTSELWRFVSTQGNMTNTDFFIPTQCPNAIICKVQQQHVMQIKQLTSTLLPVRYPDKFFSECISDPLTAEASRVVLQQSKPVGWIRCRLEPVDEMSNQLYIQAVCVLAPWRGLGLATALLDQVLKPSFISENHVQQICAHVWQSNEDALEWYAKRGFTKLHLESNYYRRLRPAGAWVMRKQLDTKHPGSAIL